jgi:hypothetical protein
VQDVSVSLSLAISLALAFPAAAQVREAQHIGGVPVLGRGVARAGDLLHDYRYAGPAIAHPGCARGEPAFVVASAAVPVCTELERGPALDELARVVRFPDGRLRHVDDLTRHARGRVYDPNPVVASGPSDVELPDLVSTTALEGRFARASSCTPVEPACVPAPIAAPDASGDYLFEPADPSFDDPFAEVSAYFHAARATRYFAGAHGFSWPACSAPSRALDVVANYTREAGVPYDNAAYVPAAGGECARVLLGQGARDYAYDGDIVYHEVSHGVIDALAPFVAFLEDELGIGYEPAALSEGYADYFGATIAGDAFPAEYVAETLPVDPAPPAALDEPLSCADLVGEPHYDGRVFAAALWSLRAELGAERADALAFRSLALQSESSTIDRAFAILAQAIDGADLSSEERASAHAIVGAHRGAGCARLVALDGPRLGYSGSPNAPRTNGVRLAPLHFLARPGSNVVVEPVAGPQRYRVLVRCGAPATAVVFDSEGPRIDAACEAPHVALVVEDLEAEGAGFFRISLDGSARAGGGGCACVAAGSFEPLPMLAAIALVRRARRRRLFLPPSDRWPRSSSTRSPGAATASWRSASSSRRASPTARSTRTATRRRGPG